MKHQQLTLARLALVLVVAALVIAPIWWLTPLLPERWSFSGTLIWIALVGVNALARYRRRSRGHPQSMSRSAHVDR